MIVLLSHSILMNLKNAFFFILFEQKCLFISVLLFDYSTQLLNFKNAHHVTLIETLCSALYVLQCIHNKTNLYI